MKGINLVCVHTYMCVCVRIYIHTSVCVCIHTYICVCVWGGYIHTWVVVVEELCISEGLFTFMVVWLFFFGGGVG